MANKEKGCETPDWTWSSPTNKECPTEKSEKGCQKPDWSSLGYGVSNSMSSTMDTSKTKNIYSSTEPSVRYQSEKNGEKPLPTGYGNVVDYTINKKSCDSGRSYGASSCGERLAAMTGGFGHAVMQSSRPPILPFPIFTTPNRTTLLNVLPRTAQVQVDSMQPYVTSKTDTFSDGKFLTHAPSFPSNHLRNKSCEYGPSPSLTNEYDAGRTSQNFSFHQSYEGDRVDRCPLPTIPPHVTVKVEKDEHGPVDVATLPIIIPPHVVVSVKVEKDVAPLQANQPHLEPKTSVKVKVRKDVAPLPSIPQSGKLIKIRKDVTAVQGVPPHVVSVKVEKDVVTSLVLEHFQPKISGKVRNDLTPLESISPHVESEKLVKSRKDVADVQSIPLHIHSEKSVKVTKDVGSVPSITNEVDKKAINDRKRACEDGYNWRKYGEKRLKKDNYVCQYYKCTYKDCKMKKRLQGPTNDWITRIIYTDCVHNHGKPHQTSFLESDDGGKLLRDDDKDDPSRDKGANSNSTISIITTASKTLVQKVTGIDILDDGYEWNKYGGKATKDNPNARNYYSCRHIGCPAKKTLQRAADDPTLLITIYKEKHNHDPPKLVIR